MAESLNFHDFEPEEIDKSVFSTFVDQYNTAFRGLENMQNKIFEIQKFFLTFFTTMGGVIYYFLNIKNNKFTYSFKVELFLLIFVIVTFWAIQIIIIHKKIEFKKHIICGMEKFMPYKYFRTHMEKTGNLEKDFYHIDYFLPVITIMLFFVFLLVV